MNYSEIKNTLVELVSGAGKILLQHFGRKLKVRQKGPQASVVSEADFASEEYIVRRLRGRYPEDSIIAEESGHIRGSSAYTWVIDPLDGTSNFVAGIPWFGVQIGVLHRSRPVASAMYLPTERALYLGILGRGVTLNGKRLQVTRETKPKNVLCAFGFDPTADRRRGRQIVELLRRISTGVRNIRTTNSLIDFCYTLDGRLGGCVNLNTKIWDIVPVSVMLPEAGGKLTDLRGEKIDFCLDDLEYTYGVLGASRSLHPMLRALLAGE